MKVSQGGVSWKAIILAIKCIVSITHYQVNDTVQVSYKLLADLVVRKIMHYNSTHGFDFRVGFSSFQFQLHPDLYCYFKVLLSYQGCALAELSGPWHPTFALGWLENLRFFIQIICWAPWILQVRSTRLPSIFLRAQPCLYTYSIVSRGDWLMKASKHQSWKQWCRSLCWKPPDHAQSFVFCPRIVTE